MLLETDNAAVEIASKIREGKFEGPEEYHVRADWAKDSSTTVVRGGETSMKPPLLLFGSRIQLWIVWREIPSSAAISAIGRPLVRVRSIIARRSSSVCRGLLILPLLNLGSASVRGSNVGC
jgi:hypothetical protein